MTSARSHLLVVDDDEGLRDLLVRYLADNGFTVLDRNWRCRAGELDIVAARGGDLVPHEGEERADDQRWTGVPCA